MKLFSIFLSINLLYSRFLSLLCISFFNLFFSITFLPRHFNNYSLPVRQVFGTLVKMIFFRKLVGAWADADWERSAWWMYQLLYILLGFILLIVGRIRCIVVIVAVRFSECRRPLYRTFASVEDICQRYNESNWVYFIELQENGVVCCTDSTSYFYRKKFAVNLVEEFSI